MTREAFDVLLTRRDELQSDHERACAILEEEGPRYAHINRRECARAYEELAKAQALIDAELAAERAEQEASP